MPQVGPLGRVGGDCVWLTTRQKIDTRYFNSEQNLHTFLCWIQSYFAGPANERFLIPALGSPGVTRGVLKNSMTRELCVFPTQEKVVQCKSHSIISDRRLPLTNPKPKLYITTTLNNTQIHIPNRKKI